MVRLKNLYMIICGYYCGKAVINTCPHVKIIILSQDTIATPFISDLYGMRNVNLGPHPSFIKDCQKHVYVLSADKINDAYYELCFSLRHSVDLSNLAALIFTKEVHQAYNDFLSNKAVQGYISHGILKDTGKIKKSMLRYSLISAIKIGGEIYLQRLTNKWHTILEALKNQEKHDAQEKLKEGNVILNQLEIAIREHISNSKK